MVLLLRFPGGETEAQRRKASLADQDGLLSHVPFSLYHRSLVLAVPVFPTGKWVWRTPLTCCSSPQDVKYLAISGFLFLRFFAPAILTPKLFDLRDQHADPQTSRSLLLLAKVQAVEGSPHKILGVLSHGGAREDQIGRPDPWKTQMRPREICLTWHLQLLKN